MERNPKQESVINNNADPPIPPRYLLSAMGHIARDLGGEPLLQTVNALNETSESNLPDALAIDLLAERDPNASEYVLTLAKEMYEDAAALERRQQRKIARRQEMAEWFRVTRGHSITGMGALMGIYIPPPKAKPKR
jgi:hypothetical protein